MFDSVLSVQFIGQRVTAERSQDSETGWCVTGWEQGIPVCRKPITVQKLSELMARCDHIVKKYER